MNRYFGFCLSIFFLWACNPSASEKTAVNPADETKYHEQYRPQFHFSPPQQWMNDPNGLVYFDGEYHLFYQHYPDSNVWGPMHWGHAISTDLVHWENLPIALYPDSAGYIFSGSAVVDHQNTSGFGEGNQPPLIAMYTIHDPIREQAGHNDWESQGIAYSNDRGRTWTKYSGNPVIPNPGNERDFRDPKVRWDEGSNQWIVVLAVQDHVAFWGSPDLKSWQHLSDWGTGIGAHGGVWECPDLFPLKYPGSDVTKWVLIVNINPGGPNGGSGSQYFIGEFDGMEFKMDDNLANQVSDGQGIWLDYGKDDYAGVTWADAPLPPERRLWIGWMSNWEYATVVPTTAWRSACTLPRELTLFQTDLGYRLASHPVQALQQLRQDSRLIDAAVIDGSLDLGKIPSTFELELELTLPDEGNFSVGLLLENENMESYRIGYSSENNRFYSDRTQAGDHRFSDLFAEGLHTAPRLSTNRQLKIHAYFDVASVELFADDGTTVMTEIYFPTSPFNHLKLQAEGIPVNLNSATIYTLHSIW
ncbi:MAG: glycoside hydrolase family 32 protein [Saprospiraceae bacterium]|nr:glycoside hydrolase family 32 protein [Saprospiraceae bacterium]